MFTFTNYNLLTLFLSIHMQDKQEWQYLVLVDMKELALLYTPGNVNSFPFLKID